MSKSIIFLFAIVLSLFGCRNHLVSQADLSISSKEITFESIVKQIKLISEIEQALRQANQDTLVALDVDYVILALTDLAQRPKAEDAKEEIAKEIFAKFSAEHGLRADAIHMLGAAAELVEPRIKDIINDLKRKNIPTIALTSMKIENLPLLGDTLQWRLNQLQKLGITFDWPMVSKRVDWSSKKAGYWAGVFLSGDIAKGKALLRLFEHLNWKPKKIIFVDDREKNIESVRLACLEAGISYHGFLYKAAIFDQDPEFDPKIYRLRLEELFKHDRYLSDEEALRVMRDIIDR